MMVSTHTVQYPIDIDIDTIEGAISLIVLLPIFTFFSISAFNSLLLYFSLNKSYLYQSQHIFKHILCFFLANILVMYLHLKFYCY